MKRYEAERVTMNSYQLALELLAALEIAKNTYDNITTNDFSLGKDKEAREAIDNAIIKANRIIYGIEPEEE